MERRVRRSRAAALKMLALGGSALVALPARIGAQGRPLVRIATLPTEAAAEVFYAQEMGFFAAAGLDAEIQTMQSGGAIAPAVAANAVEIGTATPVSAAIAHHKNIPIIVIAPAALYTAKAAFSALFVPNGSPIRNARDLTGKVIATNGLATLTEYGPRWWIDHNGGDSSQVRFVEFAFAAMPAALSAGRIDAAQIGEPALGEAMAQDHLLAYPMNSIADEFLFGVWFAQTAWAQANPDLVKRFAHAMHLTALWANQPANHPRSAEILNQYTKIPLPVIQRMVRAVYADSLSVAQMQPVVDVTAHYQGFPTFSARELLFQPTG